MSRVTEKDRAEPVLGCVEQRRPVAGEGVVEELDQAEAVLPEAARAVYVRRTDSCVVKWWHRHMMRVVSDCLHKCVAPARRCGCPYAWAERPPRAFARTSWSIR